MILSKEQILSANDLVTREVDAHEWGSPGDTVRVRALSLKERDEWRRGMLKHKPSADPKTNAIKWSLEFDEKAAELSNVRMLSIACIDADGSRIFEEKDIAALYGKSPIPIERAVKAIKEISGLTDTSVEEAEKNSEPNPSESSSTE